MKNEVNRGFIAKKRNYNQPAIMVSRIESMFIMQSASGAAIGGGEPIGGGDPDGAI